MSTETPYTDSLVEWGRSGSFYPILLPDAPSREHLELMQQQIAEQSPPSQPSIDLHSTFFYAKPPKLLKRLLQIEPTLSEAGLYNELVTTMASLTLIVHMYPLTTKVKGIGRFGPENEMVALELEDMEFRDTARDLLRRNLGWVGFTKAHLDELAKDPAYQWVFGPSSMHISLASGVGSLNTSELTLPDTVTFNGLGDGGVHAPGDTVEERHMWYLGLSPHIWQD